MGVMLADPGSVKRRHFNELRRGVPRMSPALLSKRLGTLTRAGVVERRDDGPRVTYALTEAG
jgi:DNA-binding HxlR family transcriptional regulator